ncbi:unnamed protein product, partial [Symbiodinium necroappetens]
VSLPLTVDDPATITENATLTNAMIAGFAQVMGVDASQVTLEFTTQSRRLSSRQLQATLLAIFKVTLPSAEAADQTRVAIDAVSLEDTNSAITQAAADAGYAGTIQVTGKTTAIAPAGPSSSAALSSSVKNLAFIAVLAAFCF